MFFFSKTRNEDGEGSSITPKKTTTVVEPFGGGNLAGRLGGNHPQVFVKFTVFLLDAF